MKDKRVIYLFLGLLILIAGIFAINAAVDKTKQWHSADNNIKLLMDGSEKTLQSAINESLLVRSYSIDYEDGTSAIIEHTFSPSLPSPTSGHNIGAIWISVNGVEKTLLQSLSSPYGDSLYGNTPTLSYTGPSDKSKAYHYATEIEVTVCGNKVSLQQAIDGGNFTVYSWVRGTCSASCGGGTRTVSCKKNIGGVQVADGCCIAAGTKPSASCNPQACVWFLTSTSCCSGGLSCYKTCMKEIQNPTYPSCSSLGLAIGGTCSTIGNAKTCYPGGGNGAGCCWAYTYTCK